MRSARRQKRKLVGIRTVARILECSEKTVRRLVDQKKLSAPRLMPNGQPRWFMRDVTVYLWKLWRGDFEDWPVP